MHVEESNGQDIHDDFALCSGPSEGGIKRISIANDSHILACRTLESAKKLAEGFQNTTAVSIDVSDEAALVKATEQHDLVISLIPYTFHATVIKAAIKAKKHVVTTSYVSPAMEELDAAAKEAGITVMNEIGVGRWTVPRF